MFPELEELMIVLYPKLDADTEIGDLKEIDFGGQGITKVQDQMMIYILQCFLQRNARGYEKEIKVTFVKARG